MKIDFILYFYSNFRIKRIYYNSIGLGDVFQKFRDKNFYPILYKKKGWKFCTRNFSKI